jgi:hypothetical protein
LITRFNGIFKAVDLIEIKQTSEGNPLIMSSVSDFCGSMGYCELRIRHYLKGIKPPQTQKTIDGTKSHEKEEVYEKEHFTFEPVTEEGLKDLTKDIEFAREGLFTRFQRELSFGTEKLSILLYGRADKVMRSNGTLIIEDSKYPASKGKYSIQYQPFDDQKLQTLLYLNSNYSESGSLNESDCFEISCEKKAWIINIKDKATLESIKIFQGFQTSEAKDFLNEKVTRFALIALGKVEPEHHNNVRKCQSCRFTDCQYILH